jgi:hypothetical protein
MKRGWIPLLVAALTVPSLWGCGIATYTQADDGSYTDGGSYAADDIDASYFYDALAPYGGWIWTDAYGWVWSPYDEPVDWRPYTDGQWVWTDDGWTWVADQEWGWATFHYGRWYDDPTYGWCWVPGEEWGPAWVAWREGDGWIGWAPLPPEVTWGDDGEFDWGGDWDHLPGVRHHWWSFVREGDFGRSDLPRYLAPRHRGVIRMKDTRNITKYAFINSQVVNQSFDLGRIQHAGGGEIRSYRIADLSIPPARGGRRTSPNELFVYRKPLRQAPLAKTPPQPKVPRPVPTPAVVKPPESRAGPKPAPSVEQDPREQRRREALDLQRRHDTERKELKDQTRKDQQQPPAGVSPDDLHRQQQDQQRALDEQVARDRRVLEARQQEEQHRLQEQQGRETQQRQQQLEEQRRQQDQQRQEQQKQPPKTPKQDQPREPSRKGDDKTPQVKPAEKGQTTNPANPDKGKDRADRPDRPDRPDRKK